MPKRFTDTGIWVDKPWFIDLTPAEKCAWFFITARCDAVGVWKPNFKMADLIIGAPIDWETFLQKCNSNIEVLENGKWWLLDFCEFQYGQLSEACKPHQSYIALLKKHGLYEIVISKPCPRGKTHNISETTRLFVIHRDGKVCAYCNHSVNNFDLVLDHVIPRARGGKDKAENLVVACRDCNSKKQDLELSEFITKHNLSKEEILKRVTERVSITLKEKEEEKELEREKEKDPDPRVRALTKYYADKYEARTKTKAYISWGHWGRCLKQLLRVHTEDTVRKVIDEFFGYDKRTRFAFKDFFATFNNLLPRVNGVRAGPVTTGAYVWGKCPDCGKPITNTAGMCVCGYGR